jgi:signal transduction histidine kinase
MKIYVSAQQPISLRLILILRRTILPVLLGLTSIISAQEIDPLSYTDISKITLVDTISNKIASAYVAKDSSVRKYFRYVQFKPGIINPKGIPPDKVSKTAIIKFNVFNSSDTIKGVYFFPGFYFDGITLYRARGDKLIPLPEILPENRDSIGYRYFSLAPGDSATILAELSVIKTYTSNLRPRLLNETYLDSYIFKLHNLFGDLNLVTYIFCGLLLMMILFSWANYIQGANPEFLYYSGYALFLGLMLFTKSFYSHQANRTNYFLESYLDFILQCVGTMFYMVFMKKFIETKQNFPFLNRLYNYGIILLIAAVISFSYFQFFSNNFPLQNSIETWTKILLLCMVLVFIVYTLRRWDDKLLRYLILGNLSLFIFSLASQAIISFNPGFRQLPGIFSASLLYYEIGLVLELIFFLMALSYKNRRQLIEQTRERERLKAENQKKEYEKELAVYKAQQEERNRISADMHDELGSGMTAIRLMSEIAKNKMKEDTPKEIDKISHSADDLLNKMNAIIWSMNSINDTLDNLISYIRSYSLEYFENASLECKIQTPDIIPERELSGDKRRNIFLCVKESLNNVVKHSKATSVKIEIVTNAELIIRIVDDGVGIDLNHIRQFGNGLQNITRRMKSIGGIFKIENLQGTTTTLILPI